MFYFLKQLKNTNLRFTPICKISNPVPTQYYFYGLLLTLKIILYGISDTITPLEMQPLKNCYFFKNYYKNIVRKYANKEG
jgi:hypothetical protein